MTISAAQCRAARALIAMSQKDLAASSGVSLRTIGNFELEERQPRAAIRDALRQALEAAGVRFTERGVELVPEALPAGH